ncbi:uncharacterized protein LOC127511460 [Ctenopharyngodon idella]|uniref:uncharacterized protein LOC127511460 n=1 Tax=Ctenopharyngodon idella TaxID=7959 RepID=UPI0022318DE4|nr:uncharacterized protein LOC127511460 [Ctenopharyngodon idella]
MAEARISVDQNEFLCPVCLDLLKDPVTTSCGHSYCKSCITDFWDQEDQKRVYSCPQCRQTFSPRPALSKNTMLAEVVEKLKKRKLPADCYDGAGDVQCDICTGRKHKAVKSCLVCLESYCQNHLEQHESLFKGKRHNLTEATGRLQEMICQKHDKILEVFCRTDQKFICVLCMDEHKNHDTVSAAAQRTEKQLKETQRSFQQRIQQREKDLQQLREAVESHKRSAQTAVEDSERIFTELIRSIERSRSEATQRIRDQEKTAVSRAEGRLERLEQEINDLRRRDAELEQLSHTQDHIHFLQSFQSLSAPPESTDVNDDPFSSFSSFDVVRESVHQLKDKLEDFCKEELKKISDRVTFTNIVPRTRNDFLQYSHQLTLDLNTVNKLLCLSESNKVITYTDTVQSYPDHPDRFDVRQVLCRESVCDRRCYWEIEWSGPVFVALYISVSYKSISRKGGGKECWFGYNDQSWSLRCSSSSYSFFHNNIATVLPVKSISSRIGVYVDHSAGTLSFYSVSGDTMILIHTVQTTFTQPLYPGFWVYCSGSSVKLFPEPPALDLSLCENEEMKREIEDLRKQLEKAKVNSRFGLQRFAGSDEDIRFYTRTLRSRTRTEFIHISGGISYQADLLKDLDQGQGLSPDAVAELRHTTDLALRATKQTAASIGRSMVAMLSCCVFVSLYSCSKMVEARFSQDEFLCPVCQDILKDPVTTSCGHSYCKSCITDFWDQEDQMRVYSCPQCRQTFSPRPALALNTMLAEVVEKLKKTNLPADCYAGAGDVQCDVCTGRKHKAVKSCLVCLESYCQNHLDQHENLLKGKRHNLTEATGRLQEMICQKHDKILEVFCRTDQKCICLLCTMDEHKNHDTVSSAAQRTEKQHQLQETQRSFQQKIQQREKDLQQLREAVESHKRSAQTAVEDTERIFTELIRSIERSRSEATQQTRDQEKTAVSRAEGRLERLEQEINDLRRRDAELEQLSHTQDHIHFLQGFQSLSAPPESTDVNDDPFSSLSSFDGVRESVHQLKDKLEDFCKEELKKISDRVTFTNIVPRTRNDFLLYSHQFTLDLNTVNKRLHLSERNRVITGTNTKQSYPDHPDRFDIVWQVLCRESVCDRRCYWEIEWSGDVRISVSYKSISRKGEGKECWFGCNDQSWSLFCSSSRYSFRHNNRKTVLPVEFISSRIGVYVDHSAGTLSFYSVSGDTMSLIHTVQTTFTQPLYPGFRVYSGSSVKLC